MSGKEFQINSDSAKEALRKISEFKSPLNDNNAFLIFSKYQWQQERKYRVFGFSWSDEELEAAEKNEGFIGTKFLIECYLSIPIPIKSDPPSEWRDISNINLSAEDYKKVFQDD